MGIINEALTIIRSDLDMYQSRALHYRMKAAEFGVESAMAAVGQAEAGAGAAKLTVDGWQAVEQHLHLETRRAALASVQAALEQKTQAARPLQEKVPIRPAPILPARCIGKLALARADEEIADLTTQIGTHENARPKTALRRSIILQSRTSNHDKRTEIISLIHGVGSPVPALKVAREQDFLARCQGISSYRVTQ